jgi:hypothetical protein
VKSPILDNPSYTIDLTIPYAIEEGNVQMVVRISAYPFSTKGTPVDLASIKANLDSKPVGIRITKFSISHTLTTMSISQSDSFLLSKASFEGLPMLPSVTFGGNTFWVDLDSNTNQQIVVPDDPSIGSYLLGARIFSPTWQVNLPSGMEILWNSSVYTGNISIRTALGSSYTNDVTLTAAYNPDTKQTTIAHNIASSAIKASSLFVDNNVTQMIQMNNLSYNPISSTNIKTGEIVINPSKQIVSGNRLATGGGFNQQNVSGSNPSLILNSGNKYMQILLEADEITGPSTSIISNKYNGASNMWTNNDPMGEGTFGDLARLSKDLFYPIAVDLDNGYYCIVGWLNTGFIAATFVNVFTTSSDGVPPAANQVILDGSGTTDNSNWIFLKGSMKVPVVKTPLGVAVNQQKQITVVYPLVGFDGILYAKDLQGVQSVKPWREIVSFQKITNSSSSSLGIRCPNVVFDNLTSSYVCAFWCAGKIFVTRFYDNANTQLQQLTLVAGNTNFTNASNKANPFFASAQSNNYIFNNVAVSDQSDIPSQRVGISLTTNLPQEKDAIFIFYKNSQDQVFARKVRLGVSVSSAQKIN